MESIFNEVGLGYIFQNQVGYFDKNMDKQILSDQFIQKWHSDINNSSRGQFYSGFKNDFCLENYLLRLSEYNRKLNSEHQIYVYQSKQDAGIISQGKTENVMGLGMNFIFCSYVKMKLL